MKKKKLVFIAAVCIVGLAMVSCGTVSTVSTVSEQAPMSEFVTRNSAVSELMSEKMVLNTFLDRDDYKIIGSVSGSSDFVYYSSLYDEYVGDSGLYGYIYEPESMHLGNKVFVGTGKTEAADQSSNGVLARARLNANYDLIRNLKRLGGDSIFTPVYTVETVTEEELIDGETVNTEIRYKVTVTAIAIQLIYD